ncbi:MAG: DUF4382 domain-containing protein [Candidatus Aminicenantes bacterium]
MRNLKLALKGLVALPIVGLIACGIGGSDSGQLSLSLTDAATDLYDAVYITVKQIDVHRADEGEEMWQTIATPGRTYNLLELVNGVREQLALVDLTAGHYSQLRLYLGDMPDDRANILSRPHPFPNYVIDSEQAYHELKIPSGYQSGVKIVHAFTIGESGTTELILDFSASESVVIAGRSGQYLLKPTIKVLTESEASIVSGTVTQAADEAVVEGAIVSAQVYDAGAADIKDQVAVKASTVSDETGGFKMFIAPGAYNIVAAKMDYATAAAALTTEAGMTYTQDFALAAAEKGAVGGEVTIAGATDETFVTISFRQEVTLPDGTTKVMIEVLSVNVANGGEYEIELPVGDYSVVAWTYGQTTQSTVVSVISGTPADLDFMF